MERAIGRSRFYDPTKPSIKCWHQWDLALQPGRGRKGGWAFWEVDQLRPEEAHQFKSLDVAFVPTAWHKQVAEEAGVQNAVVLRPGLDTAGLAAASLNPVRPDGVGADTVVFLTVGKWEHRKGHQELVEYFDAAFEPADDVLLIAHSFNRLSLPHYDGPADSARWAGLYRRSKMGAAGKVAVTDGWLPRAQVLGLMAGADCGVFPSRAEGWGLGAAEMLALGKRVVLTDCPGHREFAPGLDGALVCPVGPPEPAFDGVFFDGFAAWPSLDGRTKEAAVEHLRAAYRGGRHAEYADGPARFAPGGEFSWAAAARTVLGALS